MTDLAPWLAANLVCPRHKAAVTRVDSGLIGACGCQFPVVDGVPVMLLPEARQTMGLAATSLALSRQPNTDGGLYLDSLGISDAEKQGVLALARQGGKAGKEVDPVVSFMVGATNGIAYLSQVGRLAQYPIPDLRLPARDGAVFLDLGCNWGRWSIAAARKGYLAVGIDPSLGAVMAARRACAALGLNALFVVGDARYLPFRGEAVDQAFSYSVLQHFSRVDATLAVHEIGRVLKPQGQALVQMPTPFGLRCLYHQARRRFREGEGFEVRYWSIPSLRRVFGASIGMSQFSVDCFFGIGLQASDLPLMPPALKWAVRASEVLRAISQVFKPLIYLADSVYVSSVKRGT